MHRAILPKVPKWRTLTGPMVIFSPLRAVPGQTSDWVSHSRAWAASPSFAWHFHLSQNWASTGSWRPGTIAGRLQVDRHC